MDTSGIDALDGNGLLYGNRGEGVDTALVRNASGGGIKLVKDVRVRSLLKLIRDLADYSDLLLRTNSLKCCLELLLCTMLRVNCGVQENGTCL